MTLFLSDKVIDLIELKNKNSFFSMNDRAINLLIINYYYRTEEKKNRCNEKNLMKKKTRKFI